eukprot:Rhum_TRINITY_DN13152_c0_g2::Rhum_TRINITY_DN13152_c0_g2_i1::g.57478::m.57478
MLLVAFFFLLAVLFVPLERKVRGVRLPLVARQHLRVRRKRLRLRLLRRRRNTRVSVPVRRDVPRLLRRLVRRRAVRRVARGRPGGEGVRGSACVRVDVAQAQAVEVVVDVRLRVRREVGLVVQPAATSTAATGRGRPGHGRGAVCPGVGAVVGALDVVLGFGRRLVADNVARRLLLEAADLVLDVFEVVRVHVLRPRELLGEVVAQPVEDVQDVAAVHGVLVLAARQLQHLTLQHLLPLLLVRRHARRVQLRRRLRQHALRELRPGALRRGPGVHGAGCLVLLVLHEADDVEVEEDVALPVHGHKLAQLVQERVRLVQHVVVHVVVEPAPPLLVLRRRQQRLLRLELVPGKPLQLLVDPRLRQLVERDEEREQVALAHVLHVPRLERVRLHRLLHVRHGRAAVEPAHRRLVRTVVVRSERDGEVHEDGHVGVVRPQHVRRAAAAAARNDRTRPRRARRRRGPRPRRTPAVSGEPRCEVRALPRLRRREERVAEAVAARVPRPPVGRRGGVRRPRRGG